MQARLTAADLQLVGKMLTALAGQQGKPFRVVWGNSACFDPKTGTLVLPQVEEVTNPVQLAAMRTLFFHEMGHYLFTTAPSDYSSYKTKCANAYGSLGASVSNCAEDRLIEAKMASHFKGAHHAFRDGTLAAIEKLVERSGGGQPSQNVQVGLAIYAMGRHDVRQWVSPHVEAALLPARDDILSCSDPERDSEHAYNVAVKICEMLKNGGSNVDEPEPSGDEPCGPGGDEPIGGSEKDGEPEPEKPDEPDESEPGDGDGEDQDGDEEGEDDEDGDGGGSGEGEAEEGEGDEGDEDEGEGEGEGEGEEDDEDDEGTGGSIAGSGGKIDFNDNCEFDIGGAVLEAVNGAPPTAGNAALRLVRPLELPPDGQDREVTMESYYQPITGKPCKPPKVRRRRYGRPAPTPPGFHGDVVRLGGAARQRLLQILSAEAKVGWRNGMRRGALDPARLSQHELGGRVMRKRDDEEAPTTACYLLVDASGTMEGKRMYVASVAAAAFASVLSAAGHPCKVAAFTDSSQPQSVKSVFHSTTKIEQFLDSYGSCRRDEMYLKVCQHWHERYPFCKGRFQRMSTAAGGGTPGVDAMSAAYKDLLSRNEDRRVLVVFTDGDFNWSPFVRPEDLAMCRVDGYTRALCQWAQRKGVETVIIGIQTGDLSNLHDRTAVVNDLEDLASTTLVQLRKALNV